MPTRPPLSPFAAHAPASASLPLRADRLTSVMIPVALAAVGGFMLVRGLSNMYRGTGKLE
jgi:hypothetical protein